MRCRFAATYFASMEKGSGSGNCRESRFAEPTIARTSLAAGTTWPSTSTSLVDVHIHRWTGERWRKTSSIHEGRTSGADERRASSFGLSMS
jgi:hypothetical protein